MSVVEENIPELLLEQYALGELSPTDRAKLDRALELDPALRARLDGIKSSNAEILAQAPPAEMAQAINDRLKSWPVTPAAPVTPTKGGSSRFFFQRYIGFASAAAAVLLVGVLMFRVFGYPGESDTTRAKGGPASILVFKKSSAGPVQLSDGQNAAAGDILQIKYSAGDVSFGALVSLDGRGALTWHLPPLGTSATAAGVGSPALEPAGATLPSAYELDDAPSFERFFIVSSESVFDLGALDSALRALSASDSPSTRTLTLAKGISFKSLLLHKIGGN